MGRMLLILTLGFGVLFGTVRLSLQRTTGEVVGNTTNDYEWRAARNIANSAVYRALHTLSEDNHWSTGFSGEAFAGGTYDLTLTDSTADSTLLEDHLRLVGTGYCGDVSYTVETEVHGENQMPDLPGAIGIRSDSTSFNFAGNTFRIDGKDTNLDGSPGPGPDILGMAVTNAGDSTRCVAEPKSDRIQGVTPAPSIGVSDELPDLATLGEWLRRRAHYDLPGGTYSSVLWGTPFTPKIVYIDGDADIPGNSFGAGVLVVNGDLKLAGTFFWYGLLIVFGTNITIDTTVGTPEIRGGLLVQSETTFFDVRGNVDIIYSSQAIQNAHDRLDVNFYRLVAWYE